MEAHHPSDADGPLRERYDVVVAGARCAGAATAMLLARGGLRVLVVDPARPGSDTLSTHALMRGAVVQLARWGLLGELVGAGTPAVRTTTFLYTRPSGTVDRIEIPITPKGGIDALFAPRRTVLDPVLQDGAREAGAEVRLGWAITDVVRRDGVVVGAELSSVNGARRVVGADLVVGADGIRSRVARLVGADAEARASHQAATVYGYVPDPGIDGYVWAYREGVSVGMIPTNGGRACVFTSTTPDRFHAARARGLEALHRELLEACVPELAARIAAAGGPDGAVRGFAGLTGFVRRGSGPGWALVGDAAYFRDPITAHGITDALREAELLADAVLSGAPDAIAGCAETRASRVGPMMRITDRIASFDWTVEELADMHLALSREMRRLASLRPEDGRPPGRERADHGSGPSVIPIDAPLPVA